MSPSEKMTKEKKEMLVLTCIVGAIIAIFYFYIILQPSLNKISRLGNEIKGLRSDLSNVASGSTDLKALQAKTAGLKGEVEDYQKKLPAESELPNLLASVSGIAQDSGLRLIDMARVKPEPSFLDEKEKLLPLCKEILYKVTLKGGYHQLGAFVNKLENADRFFRLKNVRVKKDPQDVFAHDVKMVIATYIIQEKSE